MAFKKGKCMKYIALSCLVFASLLFAAPQKGEVREEGVSLQVWYDEKQKWVSPETYFELELKRLKGPTYGTVRKYPPYDSVKEWETLIDLSPTGAVCPMVFFHSAWRRLPDVLGLDERLRNYKGCKDVYKH